MKKIKWPFYLAKILTLVLIFYSFNINAQEIIVTNTTFESVKEAVDQASAGDKVMLPEGTIDFKDKTLFVPGGVSLIGKGKTKTLIKRNTDRVGNYLVIFLCGNGLQSELHDIGFIGLLDDSILNSGVSFSNGCENFKVSGCRFEEFTNTALNIGFTNIQKGVVYANEFLNNFHPSFINYGYAIAVYGDNLVRPPLELGTENAVFVEDNFFSGNKHHITSSMNAKYVFRYNFMEQDTDTQNFGMVDAHGRVERTKDGNGMPLVPPQVRRGTRSYEIYNNDFSTTESFSGLAFTAMYIRGGDGVIFNNTISSDLILRSVNLVAEGPLEQCLLYPEPIVDKTTSLYAWNNENNDDLYSDRNSSVDGISRSCPEYFKLNEDYYLYKKPRYIPYPYPHPLREKNIALNKPTSSSNSKYPARSTDLVVDNDTNKNNWWGTFPLGEWWQVDLEGQYNINEILVNYYYDYHRHYKYNIQASLNGTDWITIKEKNNTNVSTAAGDRYDFTNLTARYLRVTTTHNSQNGGIHLLEFGVLGALDPFRNKEPNIALNKPTSSSNSKYPTRSTSLVVDNDINRDNWWGTFPLGEWWQVDLEDQYNVNEIIVNYYYNNDRYYMYNIQASSDGIDWVTIKEKNNTNVSTENGDRYDFTNLTARYLRVTTTHNSQNGGIHLLEFRAFGDREPVSSNE